jgi:hypothetical protein
LRQWLRGGPPLLLGARRCHFWDFGRSGIS